VCQGIKLAGKLVHEEIKDLNICALVGDVVTTGSELIRALEEVIQFGAYIVKIIVIIDSGNGEGLNTILNFARLNQRDNCPVTAIYTRDEILNVNHG
jgi:orotate phosphoribosyltransferase